MTTLSVIRSCALREHLSIRVITRKTGLSPNTIHECLPYDSVQAQLVKRTIVTQLYPFGNKLSGWLPAPEKKYLHPIEIGHCYRSS